METSKLERINDKVLKKISENIIKECEQEDWHWSSVYESETIYEIFESNIRVLGIDCDTIDVDFIFSIIKLNEKSNFDLPLKRPQIGLYYQDVQVNETITTLNTYRNKLYSYSQETVTDMFRFLEDLGYRAIWDGDIIDRDTVDSEVNDYHYYKPKKAK